MAGNHQFSSNTFIQSGSVAQFLDGISVTGNAIIDGAVSATSFIDATTGNPIITGGGTTVEFFAGTVAGVDLDPPQSLDHFIQITNANGEDGSTDVLAEGNSELQIKAVGSETFNPNYFNFIKIGNLNEPAKTVQEGSNAIYTPASLEERTAGTHRYIIYASDTTQGGETHKVYHTVTLNAFVNEPPVIQPVTSTTFLLQPEHDSITANVTLHFTESSDENQLLNQGNDFISRFTAQRTVPSGTENTLTTDSYDISLTSEEVSETTPDGTQTIEVTGIAPDGLADGTDKMSFTVNLSNYNAIDSSNNNTIATSTNQTDLYSVTIEDTYSATDSGQYVVVVLPPPTATISFPIILFEGQDNDGGFTNTQRSNHTHTLLYTIGSNPPALIETTGLDPRYLSSCVRVKFQAIITEPEGLVVANDHRTAIRIMSSSTQGTIEPDGNNTLGFFRIDGNGDTATNFSSTAIDSGYSSLETNNFKTLIGNGIPSGLDEITYYFGATTNSTLLNNLDYVRHGEHHHHEVSPVPPGITSPLTIKKCPNVEIKNIDLEVETEFGKNTVTTGTHTRDLLYGLNRTILTSELNTFFPDNTITNYSSYIDQARIRVRLKCTIVEPFGPAHNQINAVISTNTGHTVSTTINLTDANNSTLNTVTSEYTTSHNHSDSYNNGKELKVSTYISELFEIELPAGTHNLEVSFTDDGVLTSKGIGITEDSVNAATIQINPVVDTTLTNVVTEIETSGYSNEGTTNSLRTVLYGDNRQTNANSSSFDGHDLVAKYSSHSVSRFRVKGILTEPPGPAVSTLTSQIKEGSNNIGSSITIDPNNPVAEASLSNVNGSTDLFSASLTTVDGSGNRVTEFVTSWLDGGHSLNASTGGTSSYTINSDFTYNFDNNSNYTANSFNDSAAKIDTTLKVFDTPETDIDILLIEIEDAGMSGVAASLNTNNTTIPTTHQRTILSGEGTTRANNTGLPDNATANNSILRTRIKAIITEPVGPLHHATDMSVKFDASTSNPDDRNGPIMSFGTGSSDMEVKTPEYIEGGADDGKLRTTYTSIFNGSAIPSVNNGSGNYNLVLFDSNITHNASNENSFKKGAEGNLYGDNFIQINEPNPLATSNIILTLNRKNEFGQVTSQVLHGKNSTEHDLTVNSTYNTDSQNQLISAFVQATIEEPVVGHAITTVSITGQDADQTVEFILSTGSNNTATGDVQSFTKDGSFITYTSIPKPLKFTSINRSQADTNESISPGIGFPEFTLNQQQYFPPATLNPNPLFGSVIEGTDTTKYTVTAQTTDINNGANFTPSTSDSQEVFILCPPPAIINHFLEMSGSNGSSVFTSSKFDPTDTAATGSFYIVFPPGSGPQKYSNTITEVISSTTNVTLPNLTSINSLAFGDGNLELKYSELGAPGTVGHQAITNTSTTARTTGDVFQNFTINNPRQSTGTGTLFNPHNSYKQVQVTTIMRNLAFGGGKSRETRRLYIFPAMPTSMSNADLSERRNYTSSIFRNSTFKTGLLSIVAGTNYTESGTPVNPTVDGGTITTQQADYIIETHNGSNNDYTIDLETHTNVAYRGSYITSSRAFNHGDKGDLKVFLNGETADITFPMGSNFETARKDSDQVWPGTTQTSTALSARVNKVAPFNGISQSLVAFGEEFLNGFQAWDASVNITSKPQDGYNYLKLTHEFSDGTPNQEMKNFEWYYDDGENTVTDLATISNEISYSMDPNQAEPTHSLSGVSYFKYNTLFTASIMGITGVVGKVYPHNKEIMYTKKIITSSTGINVFGDGQPTVSNKLKHQVHSTGTSTNRRGLRFSESDLNWIPTNESSINIHTTVQATDLIGYSSQQFVEPSQGRNFELEYHYYRRNGDTTFNTDVTIAKKIIGRFMQNNIDTGNTSTAGGNQDFVRNYVASTNHIRQFYDEFYRWDKDDFLINSLTERTSTNHETFWLDTANASYKSPLSISNTTDLQQTFQGRLIYPSQSYATANPNIVDYSSLDYTGDRVYYTALQIPNVEEGTDKFILRFEGNFAGSDIFTNGQAAAGQTPTQQMDSKNIRIDIKIPGANSGWSNPAENLGNASNTSLSTLNTSTGLPIDGNFGWKSFQGGIQQNQMSNATPHIQLRINTRDLFPGTNTGGVVLLKVRYKSTYTGYLTKIQLIEDGNETPPTS